MVAVQEHNLDKTLKKVMLTYATRITLILPLNTEKLFWMVNFFSRDKTGH